MTLRITSLMGTYDETFVEKAVLQFTFLPKIYEKGFSENGLENVFQYAIDRLWYSEVSLSDAKNFMTEALAYTDLYKDDPDRKGKVADLVEERYTLNSKNPPKFYNPEKSDALTMGYAWVNTVMGDGISYFKELTKPYDIQMKLMNISVLLEKDGEKGSGPWHETSAEFVYDEESKQARIYLYTYGERRNKNYDENLDGKGNNPEYVYFSETRSKAYLGDIRILGVAKTDKEEKIYYSINGIKYLDSLGDAKDRIISATSTQRSGPLLYIILSSLLKMDNSLKYDFVEPGFHIGDKVRIKRKDYWPPKTEIPHILKKINEFYRLTTNPNAFKIKLYFDLLGPFSYSLRQSGIMFPILFFYGESRGGKTQLASFFNNVGWDNPKANLTEKNVETKYTALKQLSNKYTSILLDEVSNSFLQPLEHFLNSASTGIGSGSRGGKGSNKLDLWDYEVLAWLTMTTNDTISMGKAFNNRLIVVHFDQGSVSRQNVEAFERIKVEFPKGWMYTLFEEVFGERNTKDIILELVKGIVREQDLVPRMFSVVESKLKELYARYGINWELTGELQWSRGFPSDYLVEIFQYFRQAAEWTEQTVFKGYDRNGEVISVDKFNKYGFNTDFFRERKKRKVLDDNGHITEAEVEGYFITLKAFKQFCKDMEIPREIRSAENFVSYIGRKEYIKVTSARIPDPNGAKGDSFRYPTKGILVLDPSVKFPAEEVAMEAGKVV